MCASVTALHPQQQQQQQHREVRLALQVVKLISRDGGSLNLPSSHLPPFHPPVSIHPSLLPSFSILPFLSPLFTLSYAFMDHGKLPSEFSQSLTAKHNLMLFEFKRTHFRANF